MNWRKTARAQFRDLGVLLRESRRPLLLFMVIVLGGAALFYLLYRYPDSDRPVTVMQALFGSFTLLFLQPSLPFPDHLFLQLLYFAIPAVGLIAVVDGVVRFGAALTNKQERGQKWQVAMASTFSNHVIICGIGKVGYRVALELLKFDREVVAVESNPDCRFIEMTKALGIPVIVADARRSENLLKAGVEHADAIIPCTDDELSNLDIALDAREINPEIKIVMRMFDPELAQRIERGFGIHTAYSVSALAAPTLAAASMRVNVKSSFYVGDTLLHISEITVRPNTPLSQSTVQQIEQDLELSIVSLVDQGQAHLHPAPNQMLAAGSKAIILASLEALHRLEKLNQP